MDKLHGTTWIIKDEDEFLNDSGIYTIVDRFIKKQEEADGVQWFFDMCYADWEEGNYSVFYTSYKMPEYKDYSLALKVTGDKDTGFEITVAQKNPID